MTGPEHSEPALLGVDSVDTSVPGQRWWQYRREAPPLAPIVSFVGGERDPAESVPDATPSKTPAVPATGPEQSARSEAADAGDQPVEVVVANSRSPMPLVGGACVVLATLYFAAASDSTSLGSLLVPVMGLLLGSAAAIWQTRNHPSEPWIGRWLVAAVAVKLVASYLRYLTLTVGYQDRAQGGDADRYHLVGREYALFWRGDGPNPALENLRRTNFVRWFDGVVQTVVGYDFLAEFFVFGLLAVAGTYMWYRAAADSVPIIDRRIYFLFVMFAPSILFWPSSPGKESLMQLGIGAIALGLSRLVTRRIVPGFALAGAGGWLVWVVRPHLLAIVAIAGGLAYLIGRVRAGHGGVMLSRPIGMVVIVLLVMLAVTQGASYLGLNDFSVESVEQTLDDQTERTSTGGSKFDPGSNSLNPIYLPQRAVNVLLRPFPWEVDTSFQLLASLESAALVALIFKRFGSVRASVRHARTMPLLLFCWTLTLLYCMAYAAFANFGLLVRQRSLVFPAVLLLLAVDPLLARKAERRAAEAQLLPVRTGAET